MALSLEGLKGEKVGLEVVEDYWDHESIADSPKRRQNASRPARL